jgi:hypothetical protein
MNYFQFTNKHLYSACYNEVKTSVNNTHKTLLMAHSSEPLMNRVPIPARLSQTLQTHQIGEFDPFIMYAKEYKSGACGRLLYALQYDQ